MLEEKDAVYMLEFKLEYYDIDSLSEHNITGFIEWRKQVAALQIGKLASCIQYPDYCSYNRYLDSEPMEFDGDIIITDPCYIIGDDDNDWSKCDYGNEMEKLGINHYMTRDTLYGDWSCTTFDIDTKESIGEFCADAGEVSVFLLDEVLKYNPKFNYHTDKPWTTTLIKDFKGTVQFVVIRDVGVYEDTTEYHKKGEKWEDFCVEVVGHGVNKKTGKAINFVGRQTGF